MEQRLSIITLGVKDLKVSRSFYEKLGWKIANTKQEETEEIVAFNLQSFVLALYRLDKLANEINITNQTNIEYRPPSFTLAYNVASEAEVDQTIKEATQVGAKILIPPKKVFWGGYSGYFSDPDHYMWEVAYNPFAKLKKGGTFRWE